MGVAGSDTALETADIALMSDDLSRIDNIITKGRLTLTVIEQNIAFAIQVKVIFVIMALFEYVDLWLAVLADTGSSILVTLNGMRLMKKIIHNIHRLIFLPENFDLVRYRSFFQPV